VTQTRRLVAILALLASGLIALDLARASVGRVLRPWQYAVALALVAVVFLLLRARGLSPRATLPWIALSLLLVPSAVDHSREIRSDGVHYYAFLRSALFDLDLDHSNDYVLLGSDYKGPDPLPIGAPLLWTPLVSLVHVGREAARIFGLPAPLGVEPLYAAAACLASWAYGAAGLFLLLGALRRCAPPRAAFWAVVVAWVGSPLRFYLSALPSMAHACEFFAAVVALWAWIQLRARPEVGPAWRAGLATGLLFLVRSQDGLMLLLPGAFLALGAFDAARRRGVLKALGALAGGFLLAALPQFLVWQAQFGVPLLVPHQRLHGASFFHASQPELWGTLLSPRGGLFVSYPALLLALVGLVWLAATPPSAAIESSALPAARRPFDTLYLLCLLPVLIGAWWLNASVFDWYQVRRYTGLVPFLAPGLAFVLHPLTRAGLLPLALVGLLAWRYDDALDARRNNPGDPVPVRLALVTMADRLAADGYALAEGWAPRTAVRLLAVYTGELLLQRDVEYVGFESDPTLLRLPRTARHLSDPQLEDGKLGRWVNDRETQLFVPLAWQGPLLVRVEARALETDATQTMALDWNGVPCGAVSMEPAWRQYSFRVPAAAVHVGTNALVLRFGLAPIYFQVRGQGPREIRPAALSWLSLNRAGPESP
jgi:hypothetical protein